VHKLNRTNKSQTVQIQFTVNFRRGSGGGGVQYIKTNMVHIRQYFNTTTYTIHQHYTFHCNKYKNEDVGGSFICNYNKKTKPDKKYHRKNKTKIVK
jgi:hypothetical protein